jgi:hypothetical protein
VVGTRGGFREDVGWEDMTPCERKIVCERINKLENSLVRKRPGTLTELMGCDMRVAVDSYPDVKKNEGVRQK